MGDSALKIKHDEVDFSTNLQNDFTYTSDNSLKKFHDVDRVMYQNISKSLDYENYKPISWKTKSGRYEYTENNLDDHVNQILNRSIQSDSDLEGQGVKTVIPSNIIDIYTRLDLLLGVHLSGHTDTLTEAINLINELYKRGEIRSKQQNQNALDKFIIH